MSCRIALTFLLLLAACPTLVRAQPDSDFYLVPKTVPEFWRAAKFEIRTGGFERAAERIKGLLALNPDDKTLFDLVENPPGGGEGGINQLLKLRNIPKWSANDRADKEAKENVEKLINQVTLALAKELKSEVRINRFVKALNGEPEESAYAIKELRRSGKAVVPVICSLLSSKPDDETRHAIYTAIPKLSDETLPGFVAYLSIAENNDKLELVQSFQKRPEFREMRSMVQTDPVPTFLQIWGNQENGPTVRAIALKGVTNWLLTDPTASAQPELRTAFGRLNAIAREFLEGKPNLGSPTGNDNGAPTYGVWVPDGKTVKEIALSQAAALEYYGLRYARWALELQPENATAQEIFLSIAIEGQANRSGGIQSLARTSPQLNAALATASYSLLNDLLEDALRTRKTAIALAVVRTLGERAELRAGKSEEIKTDGAKTKFRPSILVKALDYPDPRVKFAAADALLKIPGEPTHGRTDEIMKLLRASLSADPPAGARQKALYADPDAVRGEGISAVLQQSGFDTEVVSTGRELMKRLQRATDVDLVVIDRHIVDPMLTDLMPQIRADYRAKTLPVFVVASPEGITPVNMLTALARLAAVTAYEDLPDHPYLEMPRNDEEFRKQKLLYKAMSEAVTGRYEAQVKRMTELVAKAGFTLDEKTRARIVYLVLQTLPAASVDQFAKPLEQEERLAAFKLLSAKDAQEMEGAKIAQVRPKIGTDDSPSPSETTRILSLMRLTNTIESELPAERLPRFQLTWDAFWSRDLPRLPPIVSVRHPDIENAVARKVAGYTRVRVLPAVFTPAGLGEEIAQLVDPKAPMISPEEKTEHAAVALNWFRRMARGEVLGYRVMQAENAIRQALGSDELALIAIDTIVRMPSKLGQQDLATLATSDSRPAPIRIAATDALIRSVQTFGKFVTPEQVDALAVIAKATEDADVRAKLNTAIGALKPDAKQTGGMLKNYVPDLSAPPAKEKGPDPKEEPKEAEKKDPEKKEDPKDQ